MEGVVLALFVCCILALVTKKLSLPTIPFYIIAGLLLGKSGLQLVGQNDVSEFLTQLGLIFLLFFMGLEIKLDRIISNQSAIVKSGLIDLHINMLIGIAAAWVLGFSPFDSLVVGFAFFISSTAMTVTSLVENRKLLNPESETIVWLMVFEDLVLIAFILVSGSGGDNPFLLIGEILGGFFIFYLVARFCKPQLKAILKRDDELPVLLTFSLVLAIAYTSIALGIPESLMVIAFGVTLGATDPEAFEVHARPFKDVFLVVFFVFFGVSVDFSGGVPLSAIIIISLLAIASKFLSGILTGIVIHKSVYSGVEIWANIIGRGEFSIAIAALYGSALVSSTIAAIVIITSIAGSFIARYSTRINIALKSSGIIHPSPPRG